VDERRFELLGELGTGAIGVVHLAWDSVLRRKVALKILKPLASSLHTQGLSDRLEEMLREARAASALDHPNVAAIHDVITFEGSPCLVMQFVDGPTLRRRLAAGPVPPDEAIALCKGIASGLAAAHARGIIHRDVKPENILLTSDGIPKISDFGLARTAEPNPSGSMTEVIAGTPLYMAPEVLMGQKPDAASDVYSAGLVFYELLGGRHPFERGRTVSNPPSLDALDSRIPVRVAEIVSRTMHMDRASRFSDAREVAEALRKAETTPDQSDMPTAGMLQGEELTQPSRRSRALAKLDLTIHNTEYVNFAVVNPADLPFQIPFAECSFARFVSGLSRTPMDISRVGLSPEDYKGQMPPHIPNGEMLVDFTLHNGGPTIITRGFYVEILGWHDLPAGFVPGGFLPVLEPFEDIAILDPDRTTYPLFRGKTFSLKQGDVDLFRVNAVVSDAAPSGIIRFRLVIEYVQDGHPETLYSSEFLLAKLHAGSTPRITLEKRPSHREAPPAGAIAQPAAPARGIPEGFDAEPNPGARGKAYGDNFLAGRICSLRVEDPASFIRRNYEQAVFAGERDPIEIRGMTFEQISKPLLGTLLGDNWVEYSRRRDGKYMVEAYAKAQLYRGRRTADYDCVAFACRDLGLHGNPEDRDEVSSFLISALQADGTDAGVIIDTVPLLALLNTDVGLEVLSRAMMTKHPVIREGILDVFSWIAYPKARGPLLQVLGLNEPYGRNKLLKALGLNGDEAAARRMVQMVENGEFDDFELQHVADTVFMIARGAAAEFVRRHGDSQDDRIKRVVLQFLRNQASSGPPDTVRGRGRGWNATTTEA
jgi:serine/threonine protein kinase